MSAEAVETELGPVAVGEPTEGVVVTRTRREGLRDAMEGLRFVRSEPVLLGAISLDLVAVLFGGAVALLPAIAEDRLGVGAVGLGWLRAAVGIGAGLVTLLLAFKPVTRRVGSIMLIAVGVFGLGTIVLGLTTSYVIAFVALAVLSGADAVSVFIRGTLVPLVTPPDKRGPRARGGDGVHRRVERARRVRIRCCRSAPRARRRDRHRWRGDAGHRAELEQALPGVCARSTASPKGAVERVGAQLKPTSSAWCSYWNRQPTSRKPTSSSQPSCVSSSRAPGNTRSRLAKQPPGATSGRISR